MLTFDPAKRASAAEMLTHPWLRVEQPQQQPAAPLRSEGRGRQGKKSPVRCGGGLGPEGRQPCGWWGGSLLAGGAVLMLHWLWQVCIAAVVPVQSNRG
jgi:hypothetical protein